MATNFKETNPSTSFTVDNNCFKKNKYTFVSLLSDEINEEVAIVHNSGPVLETAATDVTAAVPYIARSTTNVLLTASSSRNTTQLIPTVSVKDSNVSKQFIRTMLDSI